MMVWLEGPGLVWWIRDVLEVVPEQRKQELSVKTWESRWHLEGGREVCLGQTAAVTGMLRDEAPLGSPPEGVWRCGHRQGKRRLTFLKSGRGTVSPLSSDAPPLGRQCQGTDCREGLGDFTAPWTRHAGGAGWANREGEGDWAQGQACQGWRCSDAEAQPRGGMAASQAEPWRCGDSARTDSWGEVAGCSWRFLGEVAGCSWRCWHRVLSLHREQRAFSGWTEGLGAYRALNNEKFPPKLKCLFHYKEMKLVMQNLEKFFFVFLTLKAVILGLWGPWLRPHAQAPSEGSRRAASGAEGTGPTGQFVGSGPLLDTGCPWFFTKSHQHQLRKRGVCCDSPRNWKILQLFVPFQTVAQWVKNLHAMQEISVQSLGWKDLEKEKVTHPSILAWEIPWTEEPGGLQSMGSHRVRHNLATKPPPPKLNIFCVKLRIQAKTSGA